MLVTGSVLAARVAVWILAVASVITGIGLIAKRRVEVFEYNQFVEAVDVIPIGIALLSVGILVLAAALIAEGYVSSAHAPASDSESTPDA